MVYLRNLVWIAVFSLIITGCGGGNTTIADNSSTTGGSTTTTGTGSTSSNTGTGGSTGTITLQWAAPTTLADGTPVSLSAISGYKVFYGSSATNTPNVINITDGSTSQYTVNLASGTYYFVICAVDSSGHQGLISVAIQKTI